MKAKKSDITHKLKIARGQIDGILQMIESDRYCVDISNQLQADPAVGTHNQCDCHCRG